MIFQSPFLEVNWFFIRFAWHQHLRQNCSKTSNFSSKLMTMEPGMKIHESSCSFVFAVFNNLNGTRVRVRSCSTFSKKWVFVFVRVQYFTAKMCSCSFAFDTLEKKYVFVFGLFNKSTRLCSVRVHVRVRYSLYCIEYSDIVTL